MFQKREQVPKCGSNEEEKKNMHTYIRGGPHCWPLRLDLQWSIVRATYSYHVNIVVAV
jgi:hypothetical protein